MNNHYDLLILGSGSTAFAAAIRAAELGYRAAMTESRTLGGTCVNRGCLPSKNLIAAAGVLETMRRPRFAGIEPCEPTIDFTTLIRQKDTLIASYREKKYDSIVRDDDRIAVYEGHATFVDARTVDVDGQRLTGEQILIATGSSPSIPAIPGLDRVPYLTSDLLTSGEPMELTTLPRSLVIVGAGYIALELGQMFRRFGSKVTLVARCGRLLNDAVYEPEVSDAYADLLRSEGAEVLLEATVERVEGDQREVRLAVSRGDDAIDIRAEKLLVASGRLPNTHDVGIARASVALDERGFVVVDETLRSSAPQIWAAGDVIGGWQGSQMATPVGAQDGALAAENALTGAGRRVDHRVIPRAIFTDPPFAAIGMSEAQAIADGTRVRSTTVPMELVPRAAAVHDTFGLIRMIVEDGTDRVLGVQMLGQAAHEVIHEAAMALRFRATLDDLIDQVHIYPTMAESLKIAALSFRKDVTKLSCCAE